MIESLLALNPNDYQICAADFNYDHVIDGDDIQAFVTLLLAHP